jgi:hypothetical protein
MSENRNNRELLMYLLEENKAIVLSDLQDNIKKTKGIRRLLKGLIYRIGAWLTRPIYKYLSDYSASTAAIIQHLYQYSTMLEQNVSRQYDSLVKIEGEMAYHRDYVERLETETEQRFNDSLVKTDQIQTLLNSNVLRLEEWENTLNGGIIKLCELETALQQHIGRIESLERFRKEEWANTLNVGTVKLRELEGTLQQNIGRAEFLGQYIQENRQLIEGQSTETSDRLQKLRDDLDQINAWTIAMRHFIDDREQKSEALARYSVRTNWKFTDYVLSNEDQSERVVECLICLHREKIGKLEKMYSKCIFSGGNLERYVCPSCGAIFGPVKFSDQTDGERDDDYIVHYIGYREADSTEREIAIFHLLEPRKDKVYLCYGCGSWSKSLQKLTEDGYTVYGYEPYSPDISNYDQMIISRDKLSKMRFDGIFSNDVLEHFVDPVEEMIFMKTLLSHPSSKMAHGTGCYLYKYEYTRFHTCFFTGRSVDVMCERAGLSHGDFIELDENYCYVYGVKENAINYLPEMLLLNGGERKEGLISLAPGTIMYGPYIQLPKGSYRLRIKAKIPEQCRDFSCNVTANSGSVLLYAKVLKNGWNMLDIDLNEIYIGLEFVMRNTSPDILIEIMAIELQ